MMEDKNRPPKKSLLYNAVIILLVAMGMEILLLDRNPVVISGLAVGVAVCLLVILAYAFWQAMGQK